MNNLIEEKNHLDYETIEFYEKFSQYEIIQKALMEFMGYNKQYSYPEDKLKQLSKMELIQLIELYRNMYKRLLEEVDQDKKRKFKLELDAIYTMLEIFTK